MTYRIERRIQQNGAAYLIVTRNMGMKDDEVATFSGPNADARAKAYAEAVYPTKE